MKPYVLPDLPYDYSALEPHYSARVLELHHGKHHKAYVDGVNTTLDRLAGARAAGRRRSISSPPRAASSNSHSKNPARTPYSLTSCRMPARARSATSKPVSLAKVHPHTAGTNPRPARTSMKKSTSC
jgi:superoxide dismutase